MRHRNILFPEKYAVYYCAKFTPKLQQKSFFSDFSRLLLKNLIKAVFIDVKFEELQKKKLMSGKANWFQNCYQSKIRLLLYTFVDYSDTHLKSWQLDERL